MSEVVLFSSGGNIRTLINELCSNIRLTLTEMQHPTIEFDKQIERCSRLSMVENGIRFIDPEHPNILPGLIQEFELTIDTTKRHHKNAEFLAALTEVINRNSSYRGFIHTYEIEKMDERKLIVLKHSEYGELIRINITLAKEEKPTTVETKDLFTKKIVSFNADEFNDQYILVIDMEDVLEVAGYITSRIPQKEKDIQNPLRLPLVFRVRDPETGVYQYLMNAYRKNDPMNTTALIDVTNYLPTPPIKEA